MDDLMGPDPADDEAFVKFHDDNIRAILELQAEGVSDEQMTKTLIRERVASWG